MGTGVMIGAGIFALTGQMAELARGWFPYAFLLAAIVAGFSAYSYVKLSQAYPSAGGIAMFLKKQYGESTITGACALLMYFSMVINESLVARTFGTYSLQLFDISDSSIMVPVLGVTILIVAFIINLLENTVIQNISFITASVKILGLVVIAFGGLLFSKSSITEIALPSSQDFSLLTFLGASALGILAFKGFTTITNSGSELQNASNNVGRAIIISICICLILYLLVSFAVSANLTFDQIVASKNYSLAEASRPAFGKYGMWFTVCFAIIATVSGLIASIFAVSRMLAMLTKMDLVPYSHLGITGRIQKHTLVYTVALAILLTVLFDLSRIASMGAIFYITMDIFIHFGLLRNLRNEIEFSHLVVVLAILLDLILILSFIWVKYSSDRMIIFLSLFGIVSIFSLEKIFLKYNRRSEKSTFP